MPENLKNTSKSTPLKIRVWLDGLPPNPNKTRGLHWSKLYKEAQDWKNTAYLLCKSIYHGAPLERAHLHYHVLVGDNRRRDADNIVASLKPVQDGIREAMLVDDDIDHIQVTYTFSRESPRGVEITITEL